MSKEELFKKWDSILEHNILESKAQSNTFESLLPVAMRVAAKTIGQDLVTVQPLSGPSFGISKEEMERIELETKQKNRDSKIDSLVEGKEYKEEKVENHPDYKSGSGLFYLDFVYGKPSIPAQKYTGQCNVQQSPKDFKSLMPPKKFNL